MKRVLLWLACTLWPIAGLGAEGCPDQARSPLEKAYCQIDAAGFATGLPPLREFSKNNQRTQRLLLVRPAKKAGVKLPPEPKPVVTKAAAEKSANVKPASSTPSPSRAQRPKATAIAQRNAEALSCDLQKEVVICGGDRFPLLGNQANGALAANALSAETKLGLDEFSGDAKNNLLVMDYLDESYARYITAMAKIGLAGSTLSFTKFYHAFLEAQNNRSNFSARMATMFEFLKKDKKAMAVPAHFTSQRPENISQCRRLASQFIVCDDVKHNWVYRKAG